MRRQSRDDSAILVAFLIGLLAVACAPNTLGDRTVLPIPEPERPLYSELDVRNATPPPHFEVKAPGGARMS